MTSFKNKPKIIAAAAAFLAVNAVTAINSYQVDMNVAPQATQQFQNLRGDAFVQARLARLSAPYAAPVAQLQGSADYKGALLTDFSQQVGNWPVTAKTSLGYALATIGVVGSWAGTSYYQYDQREHQAHFKYALTLPGLKN